jgi:hypothetical protein
MVAGLMVLVIHMRVPLPSAWLSSALNARETEGQIKARSVAPSSPRHITTSVAERDGGCGVCHTAGAVLATINAKDPNPFSFHPRIVAGNVDKP